MKLLLDTHVWIWSFARRASLGDGVAAALGQRTSEIWISPISIWELGLLREKGRANIDQPVVEWVRQARTRLAWHEAVLTEEVAMENAGLDWAHRDPADRWLVATARVYELTLVTADRIILRSGLCDVLANK